MILELLKTLLLLLKNIRFYIIFIISLLLTMQISANSCSTEGLKMIPSTIGVLLGGLLAAVAIIFSIIKDEDLKVLYNKYGNKFSESIQTLKYHITAIIGYLLISLLSFIINAPNKVVYLISYLNISIFNIFSFVEIFSFLLSLSSTLEVIHVLFLIFEIKFVMITREK